MRRYLTLFSVLVTFSLAGCFSDMGATTSQPRSVWRTPSGGEISRRDLPEFGTTANPTGEAPLMTADTGRSAPTPYYSSDKTAEQPTVKVALLVPMSGPQGELGQAMLNAAQMALFDIGASNVTIIPRDTSSGARRAATEAIDEGAQMILGPLFAQDVKDVSPVANDRHIPVIAFSTDWTAANSNTYIMGFLPFGQVARVVEYATRKGSQNFASLVPNTPYGMAVNVTLQKVASSQNLPTTKSFIFNGNEMSQAVQELSAHQHSSPISAADAVLLPLGGAQLNQAATMLRQNDISVRETHLLGTGLWDDSPQAGALLPGGWYAAPDPSLRRKFNMQYAATYGSQAPRLATLAYDATALAAALAVKGINETGQPAYDRASITNPSGFSGIDGIFRFRPDGLAERGLAVLELRPGTSVVIDPAPKKF